MTRVKNVSMVIAVGLVVVALASAAWSQVRVSRIKDCEPDLSKSIGLQCVVYLRVQPDGPSGTIQKYGTFELDRDRPVIIEGILTGVSGDAITMRNSERVFWVNRDQVGVVMFENM